jgi:hypothetical protein
MYYEVVFRSSAADPHPTRVSLSGLAFADEMVQRLSLAPDSKRTSAVALVRAEVETLMARDRVKLEPRLPAACANGIHFPAGRYIRSATEVYRDHGDRFTLNREQVVVMPGDSQHVWTGDLNWPEYGLDELPYYNSTHGLPRGKRVAVSMQSLTDGTWSMAIGITNSDGAISPVQYTLELSDRVPVTPAGRPCTP